MIRMFLFLFFVCAMLPSPVYSAQLTVADSAITTAVLEQNPVDRESSFPADFGKLFCFTRIVGAETDTMITHVWYYQDQEMARIELPIKSSDWRTYSSKRFLPQWAGQWHVVVLDENLKPLESIPFELK